MNDLDFSFEDSPWEAFLRTKRAGDTVSAANLLTMLEEENEQVVEDALQALEDGGLNLDVFDLPKTSGSTPRCCRVCTACGRKGRQSHSPPVTGKTSQSLRGTAIMA